MKITKKKPVYCIMGKTAVGKDTLVNDMIKEKGMSQVISYSTRPQRVGENGTHIFITSDDVCKFHDFVAYTKIGEYEYFATKEQLDKNDFYIIDPKGYYMLLQSKYSNEYNFIPILCVLDSETQIARSISRGDDPEVFKKRSKAESDQFAEFMNAGVPYYTIDMGDKAKAKQQLEQIIDNIEKEVKKD